MKITTPTQDIGWAGTAVLRATMCRQVYSQWKSKATAGVSRWLFIGQTGASIEFVYRQLHSSVFLLERGNDGRSDRGRSHLHLKSQAIGYACGAACLIGLPAATPIPLPGSAHSAIPCASSAPKAGIGNRRRTSV